MKYSDIEIIGTYSDRTVSPHFELECQELICQSFVELMQSKGLYQNIIIDTKSIFPISNGLPLSSKGHDSFPALIKEFTLRPWGQISRGKGSKMTFQHDRGIVPPFNSSDAELPINFYLPEIETYCCHCKKTTTHLSMNSSVFDGIEELYPDEINFKEQVFIPYYNCGLCSKNIIVFLIKRKGLKLSLRGRSERLKINVDNIIPKKFQEIVEDALSAVNENDLFAGFYHLRTFLEHYMKDILAIPVEEAKRGDELTKLYNDTLNEKMLSGFPSFASIYERLSKYMHSRSGEIGEFQKILEDIYNHFRVKELFKKYTSGP